MSKNYKVVIYYENDVLFKTEKKEFENMDVFEAKLKFKKDYPFYKIISIQTYPIGVKNEGEENNSH
jgi:hypothetical protein